MKKSCIIGVLAGICGLANATPSGISTTFNYGNAYEWGISSSSITVPTGSQLSSFTVSFNATLSNEAHGTLYIDLLNLAPVTGITSKSYSTTKLPSGDYWGSSLSGVKFKSAAVPLAARTFNQGVNTPVSITIDSSTPAVLAALILDLSSFGGFDIGFTPNCHYAISKLCYSYTTVTTHTSVPDTATTVLLLGASLAGLELLRRKLALAK